MELTTVISHVGSVMLPENLLKLVLNVKKLM
jgi:hypothetical protein